MKRYIITFLICFPSVSYCGEMLGGWLRNNEPIVKNYLLSLPTSKIGRKIKGVTLTDGKLELNEALYLENKSNKNKGHYIYKFKTVYSGITYENYYLWSNSKPIEFPTCKDEWLVPGGFSVLSGDNYTYKSVQPTGQLVIVS